MTKSQNNSNVSLWTHSQFIIRFFTIQINDNICLKYPLSVFPLWISDHSHIYPGMKNIPNGSQTFKPHWRMTYIQYHKVLLYAITNTSVRHVKVNWFKPPWKLISTSQLHIEARPQACSHRSVALTHPCIIPLIYSGVVKLVLLHRMRHDRNGIKWVFAQSSGTRTFLPLATYKLHWPWQIS